MGRRAYFSLDLIELTMTGLQKVTLFSRLSNGSNFYVATFVFYRSNKNCVSCFCLQIGMWNPRDGINITKDYSETVVEVADSLKNKTLVVTTILVREYSQCLLQILNV